MANKMLIDASHPEETRVVVVRGQKVEEFDFESATRKQLRGNIYLAKVTRVEPSLQAAFVEYGGNRHGFLAFSEIHPDYYQIPVADRQALLEADAEAQREEEREEEQRRNRRRRSAPKRSRDDAAVTSSEADADDGDELPKAGDADERRARSRRRVRSRQRRPTSRRRTQPASAGSARLRRSSATPPRTRPTPTRPTDGVRSAVTNDGLVEAEARPMSDEARRR